MVLYCGRPGVPSRSIDREPTRSGWGTCGSATHEEVATWKVRALDCLAHSVLCFSPLRRTRLDRDTLKLGLTTHSPRPTMPLVRRPERPPNRLRGWLDSASLTGVHRGEPSEHVQATNPVGLLTQQPHDPSLPHSTKQAEAPNMAPSTDDLLALLRKVPQELFDDIHSLVFSISSRERVIGKDFEPPAQLQVNRATRARLLEE